MRQRPGRKEREVTDVVLAGPWREPAVGSSTMNAKAKEGDGGDAGRVDATHDPGAERATRRAEPIENAAAEPIQVAGGGMVRVGTASWTDPTMTASGVFYPAAASTA